MSLQGTGDEILRYGRQVNWAIHFRVLISLKTCTRSHIQKLSEGAAHQHELVHLALVEQGDAIF